MIALPPSLQAAADALLASPPPLTRDAERAIRALAIAPAGHGQAKAVA